MEEGVEEIIEQVVANKRTLIRLLKDKIKEFQDLTINTARKPTTLVVGGIAANMVLYTYGR